jgi:DNA-binding XRE family transcriptional regulator
MALKIKQAQLNHYEKTGEWITQIELAKKTDVNPKTIWELEKNQTNQSTRFLKLRMCLGVRWRS